MGQNLKGFPHQAKVYAFDRDATLVWGNPPGPITKEHLLRLRELVYTIGGSGGQLPEEQYRDRRENGIEPDFAVHKANLATLKHRYGSIIHVGDAEDDRAYAETAGIGYMKPEEFVTHVEGLK